MDEFLTIQWNGLSMAQLIYVQAVVMFEIETVLHKHMNTIFELGFNSNFNQEREEKM